MKGQDRALAGRGPQAGTGIGFMLLSVFCFIKCPNLDSAVFGEIEAMIWISHLEPTGSGLWLFSDRAKGNRIPGGH